MKFNKLLTRLRSGRPLLAVLIDPDKFNPALIGLATALKVNCLLVGGSRLENSDAAKTVRHIKKLTKLPVVLFPGDETQLAREADGLLLLSLLSGRNPDYLIEKHIRAAPIIRQMKLPYLSTAYLLIAGGKPSATQQVTNTQPLDPGDVSYIVNTAIAAEQLGFKAIYLEAGSGATSSIAPALIRRIRQKTALPVIVGGGIDSSQKARQAIAAGANMIVVGNALEKNMHLLSEISSCF